MNRSTCPETISVADTFGLDLPRQGMFTVADAAQVRVVCTQGAVWITLDNDTRDTVLEPGEVYNAKEHRRAVIYALKPSHIQVSRLTQAAWAPAVRLRARLGVGQSYSPALAASAIWS
jgi:Protein of unknown function (DUF2917)